MRKTTATVALALGFTLPFAVPAVAAELDNGAGASCDGIGTWHFVNNQTEGTTTPGTIDVEFSTGTVSATASTVNRNTQHFLVPTAGDATLLSAETDLPGRLVLSDFTCEEDGDGDGGKKG